MAIGLAISGPGGVGQLSAQLSPAGMYRSGTVTLELSSDRHAALTGPSGLLSLGSYRVARDTIVFVDETGPAACPGEAGRYLWRLRVDSLLLRLVGDPCEPRRTALVNLWVRAPRGTGPAVQALDAIIVTAERQVKDAQHSPVSVTVLSAEDVREASVTRPQDLTYLVPGLQVGSLLGAAAMVYLRGVGNFAGTSLQDPTVTFNFDGVYIARPTSTGGLFYDLERVEVLKGPQGTLYGRNATGGAVNILPQRPVRNALTGAVAAEYGEHNTVRVDGALNVPLGSRAAIRVAGQRARHDAYLNDGTDDQDDWAGRVSVRFDINDQIAARVVADYYDQSGQGTGSTPLATGVANRWGVTSAEGGAYYEGQRVTIAGRNWEPLPSIQRENNHHGGVNATIDWQTPLGALTLVSGYRRSRLDAISSSTGTLVTAQEHSRQTSLEARIVSLPLARVQTLAGVFLFDESIETRDGELVRPWHQFNFALVRPQSGVTSAAGFGRVTWHATDRFRATFGARYTQEKKPFRGTVENFSRICPSGSCPNAQPFAVGITTPPLVFPPDSVTVRQFNPADGTLTIGFRILADETATFARPTWRTALEYDLAERVFVFGSYETGFKSGGFFFSSDSKVFQPERLGAFTLGLKSRLFANRLQANIELFDWRYRDQQVSKLSIDSRGATSLRTENIGRASIRGAEVDVESLLFSTTWVTASVQYLDATYDSYTYLTPRSSGPPVSGCSVSSASTNGDFQVDCSGKRAPYAPEWTLALGARHALRLSGGARFTGHARTRYQSATLMGQDFLAQQRQDGYWISDASLTFGTASDRYSIGVFGQNLTDKTVVSNTNVVPFSTFAVGVLRPPRTFGMRASAGFARNRMR